MKFQTPVTEIIQKRFSCRTYLDRPLNDEIRRSLAYISAETREGPLGNRMRFRLVAATNEDSKSLRGLRTYGFIKNAAGFIIGATRNGDKNLEDFGYLMEKIILHATDFGLGTCWLGGTFTKSRFARKATIQQDEIIPAVTAVGYIAPKTRYLDFKVRQFARANQRRSWERLFYKTNFETPLSKEDAGDYAIPLEMVRLGPSASNKQPWQIIKKGDNWHFYLRRTPGYLNSKSARILQMADLQRIDIGIAMCHFELTAQELGLSGKWEVIEPDIQKPTELYEYTVSWVI